MSEHDESSKPALDEDNPPQQDDDGEKGLGTETDAEVTAGSDVITSMPDARGEVRYPDVEDPDKDRSDIAPQEGRVEKDPDTASDAASGADD
ncbi:MAG: hypothetical protein ABI948_07870 [Thermoleophilia bacterium]